MDLRTYEGQIALEELRELAKERPALFTEQEKLGITLCKCRQHRKIIHRLHARTTSREFTWALQEVINNTLTSEENAVAIHCFLQGKSIRSLADKAQCTMWKIRRIRNKLLWEAGIR